MAATATFTSQARGRGGRLVSGTIDAESQSAVAQRLKSMGYAPVSITESNAGLSKEIKLPGFGSKVKLKDLAVFSRQFATMINSGLSLLRALTILTEQTEREALRTVIGQVRNDIEAGLSLSSAMGKHPKIFPPLMVNMTKAGEVGGLIESALAVPAVMEGNWHCAIGAGENPQWLYTVVFPARELWGEDADPSITVSIEAFEPYLAPA